MKLWGGRFNSKDTSLLDNFNNSISYDWILYPYDIAGSIAHAKMLNHVSLLNDEELKQIVSGLIEIKKEIDEGNFNFKIEHEDIHMNVEAELTSRIGEAGKKLHTARSRNDQVAVDMRLYLKEKINDLKELIKKLNNTLINISEEHIDTVVPGFTHLQKAQPVRLAFHLMAYVEMFKRDHERLCDCYKRVDIMPLGSGALAGTSYSTDREYLAKLLEFSEISSNAMDAVSDRDYIIEFANAASTTMMHLSRFCEEIIIWSSDEFSYIELSDDFTTGSSIMPQKKNPDVAELIRGKTASVYGAQMALLSMMKALPLAYNKDMQEDKLHMFGIVDNLYNSLEIFIEMIGSAKFNKTKMKSACEKGYINATDMADYLVRKGLSFRESHEVVGSVVMFAITNGLGLSDIKLEKLLEFNELFENDVYEAIDILTCIESKKSAGSTNKENVLKMIKNNK